MSQFHITVTVGSLRQDSLNKLLAKALARLAPAEPSSKQVQISDLSLYKLGICIRAGSRELLQGWMDPYVVWIRKHAQ